ncbi:hypothetical protein WJX74_001907 [Apatococcus lobatus]|uniref:Condensin complex subunit 1 n=1 Tax=Apatococcus lobatus TaxID=904363 RepID=A0AAW1RQR6_9CHLO
MEFRIPARPEDLLSDGDGLRVSTANDYSSTSIEELEELAEGVAYDICESDALCITEQHVLDGVFSLLRVFPRLPGLARARLLDGLAMNMSYLCKSVTALLTSSSQPDDYEHMALAHRSALKAYMFFLHWIATQAKLDDQQQAAQDASAGLPPTGRGRSRKKGASGAGSERLLQWDWPSQAERLLRGAACMADVDLNGLFRPQDPDDRLLQLWMQLGLLMLEQPFAAKGAGIKEAVARMLSSAAATHGHMEVVVGGLSSLLGKHDHMGPLAAELAALSQNSCCDDALAVELLREVTGVEPAEYDRQQAADAAGVKNVAIFLTELSTRVPKLVLMNISLLMPHLGGKAYSIRSAIVAAVGHILHKGFPDQLEAGQEEGTPGQAGLLRAKQQLLALLLERVQDQTSYTRKQVLASWTLLAEHAKIPISHWVPVAELGIGRLDDKSALVRKAALQLMGAMTAANPFGPFLNLNAFKGSLEEQRQKLQEKLPACAASASEGPQGQESSTGLATEGSSTLASDASNTASESLANIKPEPMEADSLSGQQDARTDADMDLDVGASATSSAHPEAERLDPEVEQLKFLVASLEAGVRFGGCLREALGTIIQLLASATTTDVQEAVTLLMTFRQFQVDGTGQALRRMLPLVFSREQGVREIVTEAIHQAYIAQEGAPDHHKAAQNLIDLAAEASCGELSSLEEALGTLLTSGQLRPGVIKALWGIAGPACQRLAASGGSDEAARREARGAVAVLAAASDGHPQHVATNLGLLIQAGFQAGHGDALIMRSAAIMLHRLQKLPEEAPSQPQTIAKPQHTALHPAWQCLVGLLLGTGANLQGNGWFTAAEASVGAIYALHPHPHLICGEVLQRLGTIAFAPQHSSVVGTAGAGSAASISHFLFLLGHVALQHLVYTEGLVKRIRKARAEAEKTALEGKAADASVGSGAADEDIASQVGTGKSVAADAELDSLKDAVEREIVASGQLIGRWGPLVQQLCHDRNLLMCQADVCSSALLALTKLMVIDAGFCEDNLQLLFTLLQARSVSARVRCNLIVAMGDLAVRFPNILEPWTSHMYQPLSDADLGVKRTALMVLSHLILNDMMKLARRASKTSNPIYNVLPDILSSLSAETTLPAEDFRAIMKHLLGFIGKERQLDSLTSKLTQRFQATEVPAQRRNIAFCLAQLTVSEKGLKKLAEGLKRCKDLLADEDTMTHLQVIEAKAKKVPKQTQDFKAALEALQELLNAAARDLAARAEFTANAAAAASATADPPADDISGPPGDNTNNTMSDAAEPGESSLSAVTDPAQRASPVAAALEPVYQQNQAPWDESASQTARGSHVSTDMAGLEQQMASLAVTNISQLPAAGHHSGTSRDRASSPESHASGTRRSLRRDSIEAGQVQASAEGMRGVASSAEDFKTASMPAGLQQQYDRISLSQSSGLTGPDLPKETSWSEDLPATQLQDSERSLPSQASDTNIDSDNDQQATTKDLCLPKQSNDQKHRSAVHETPESRGLQNVHSKLPADDSASSHDLLPATQAFPDSQQQSGLLAHVKLEAESDSGAGADGSTTRRSGLSKLSVSRAMKARVKTEPEDENSSHAANKPRALSSACLSRKIPSTSTTISNPPSALKRRTLAAMQDWSDDD